MGLALCLLPAFAASGTAAVPCSRSNPDELPQVDFPTYLPHNDQIEFLLPPDDTRSSSRPDCFVLGSTKQEEFYILDAPSFWSRSKEKVYHGAKLLIGVNGERALEIFEDADGSFYILNDGSLFILYQSAKPDVARQEPRAPLENRILQNFGPVPAWWKPDGMRRVFPDETPPLHFINAHYLTDGIHTYFLNKPDLAVQSRQPLELLRLDGVDPAAAAPLPTDPRALRSGTDLYYDGRKTAIDASTFTMLGNGYQKDAKGIYYRYEPISAVREEAAPSGQPADVLQIQTATGGELAGNVDVGTFMMLDSGYAKDASAVYYNGKRVPDANARAFRTLPSTPGYAKDKNHIFYKGQKVFPGADPATFRFQGNFAADAWRVWLKDSSLQDNGQTPLRGISAQRFFLLYKRSYATDSKIVFYNDRKIDRAHVPTFWVFENERYSRDKNRVYFDGMEVPGADPLTFKPLTDGSNPDAPAAGYSVDKRNVYYESGTKLQILQEADPATFRAVHAQWVLDATHVWRRHSPKPVEGMTPEGFAPLAFDYIKTANAVYWHATRIEGATPATFKPLNETFALDGKTLFVGGNRAGDIEPATFAILGGAYAKDARSVFYGHRFIQGADAASFSLLPAPPGYLDLAAGGSRPRYMDYAKDALQVYYQGRAIPGADPATFRIDENGFARDALWFYEKDQGVQSPYKKQLRRRHGRR